MPTDDKCHWEYDEDDSIHCGNVVTGCGKELFCDELDLEYTPYCPGCGKKIELEVTV